MTKEKKPLNKGFEALQTQSAGGVVININGEILIVNQKGTSWSLPKGHVEKGEDFLTAAKREIYEESGLKQLEYISELGSYQRYKIHDQGGEDKSEFKTIHMFLFKTLEVELRPQDPENPEARWVKKDEVANLLTHPKDREFFLKYTESA